MEDAIKKVVTTFLQSSRGKENLDSKSFQKMVSANLRNILEVRTNHPNSTCLCRLPFDVPAFACARSRTQTAPPPSKRCSEAWTRTTMERSASRNTSRWLATWPTPSVTARSLSKRPTNAAASKVFRTLGSPAFLFSFLEILSAFFHL